MVQKAMDRMTAVALVLALVAGLLALLVFSGITSTDDLRAMARVESCGVAPTLALRESVATVALRSPGDHDLAAATARLRELGYDVEFVAASPAAGTAGRFLTARARAPQELADGQVIAVPADGTAELRLGANAYRGDWVIEVACGEPADATP